jgi:hypothetical protein
MSNRFTPPQRTPWLDSRHRFYTVAAHLQKAALTHAATLNHGKL